MRLFRFFLLFLSLPLIPIASTAQHDTPRRVVFLAGTKSHAPGDHEYERGSRLLAASLKASHPSWDVQVHLYGWPEDEGVLDRADAIVLYSDGSDRSAEAHPLLHGARLQTLARQMRRGAGLVALHYSLFVPDEPAGSLFMDWLGGYFDYQGGDGPNGWESRIQHVSTTANGTTEHPVLRGVAPLEVREEFYYRMKFRPEDSRRTDLLQAAIPGEDRPQTVAWAVQREDGGRGFAYTGGHFHLNWSLPPARRLLVNAIAWSAGAEIARGGEPAPYRPEAEQLGVLLVTGRQHPAHNWIATSLAIEDALRDPRVRLDRIEDPEDLRKLDLRRYRTILLNYCNWQSPTLSTEARDRLYRFVEAGGGLIPIHFANGAWRDWPGYARLARRRWKDGASGHDAWGRFLVTPGPAPHRITAGIAPFQIMDELYYRQEGDLPVETLLTAKSRDTGSEEPLAFVYSEGKGRIFQLLLGHAEESLRTPAVMEMLRRASAWTAGFEILPRPIAANPPALPAAPGSLTSYTPIPAGAFDENSGWPVTGGEPGGSRYSRLREIDTRNVSQLSQAWSFSTGDAGPGNSTTIECTPIVVGRVMFVSTARVAVVALDAATGKPYWKFDPGVNRGVNRGAVHWWDGKKGGERRILFGTAAGQLFSLDAATGRPDARFANRGVLDLRAGIERDISRLNYAVTSAPALFENLVIVPVANAENQPGAPGDIRAFDVRTGREAWRFRTVPAPGEIGHETWKGDGWKNRSGVNPWSGFTVDTARGILFCGLGSAASDYWGGDRHGANLFANSTLALDARTGKRIWHFKTLHHDIWDRDLPCPPVLCHIRRGGRRLDAAAQVTKTGYLFLFNRITGRPLFPVEERPVPASDVPGEEAAATQPFPLKPPPLSRQFVGVDDLTNISPDAHLHARRQFDKLRAGHAFTPPSLQGTIVFPGFHGGANWSGAAFDPELGYLFVNTNNVANVSTIVKKGEIYDHTGYFRFEDHEGFPAVKPPWGNLTAIDLNKGEFAWRNVFGEHPALVKRGIRNTGTENFGGAIVTAGGILFIGGTMDEKFHAYDSRTGRLLWETKLPAGGYATPCTYQVGGRQYVVIAAGGGGKLRTPSGDRFIAFTLNGSGGR